MCVMRCTGIAQSMYYVWSKEFSWRPASGGWRPILPGPRARMRCRVIPSLLKVSRYVCLPLSALSTVFMGRHRWPEGTDEPYELPFRNPIEMPPIHLHVMFQIVRRSNKGFGTYGHPLCCLITTNFRRSP